jgi:ComF family protein
VAQGERGRFVFSSSGDPIRITGTRITGTQVTPRDGSPVSVLLSSVNGVAASLFATLFPSDCRLCGTPLTNISRLPVCQACLVAIRPIAGGICSVCGERLLSPHAFVAGQDEARCGLCRRLEPPFSKAVAYGSYDGDLRELIHLLKYEQVRPAAATLGRMLAEAIAGLELASASSLTQPRVAVVPVPLHARKLRQRGFNQSELIVRNALKVRDLSGRRALHAGVLERRRETQSQTGLTRHQRRENIRGAFVVARPEQIAGRQVLLVDDVFTTGTTVSECARVLHRAGAAKIYVATVARTLKADATLLRNFAEAGQTEYGEAEHGETGRGGTLAAAG